MIKLITILKQNNILTEHFVNVFSKTDMEKYVDVVWDLLQNTYKAFGGFQSATSKDDLIDKSMLWKMVRKHGDIIAVAVYKDKYGRKSIAKGSDGSQEGKDAIKQIYYEDVKFNRCWGEFSGPAEKLMLKNGAVPIPREYVEDIINKKITPVDDPIDKYHYIRDIKGKLCTKILLGTLKK